MHRPPIPPPPPSPSTPATTLPHSISRQPIQVQPITPSPSQKGIPPQQSSPKHGGTSLADVDSTTFDKIDVAFTQANFADDDNESLVINGASGGTILQPQKSRRQLNRHLHPQSPAQTLSTTTPSQSPQAPPPSPSQEIASRTHHRTSRSSPRCSPLYNNSDQNPTASSDRVLTVNSLRWRCTGLQYHHLHHHRQRRQRRSDTRSRDNR